MFSSYRQMVYNGRSDQAMVQHRVGYLDETGDIGPDDIVARRSVFRSRFGTLLVYVYHYTVQLLLNFLEGPGQTDMVLAHLES